MRVRALVAAGGLVLAVLAAGCGSKGSASAAPTTGSSTTGSSITSSSTTNCSYPADGQPAKPVSAPPAAEPSSGAATAELVLNSGTVTLTLDRNRTPCTVGSFTHLAGAGYFDNTSCHRLTTAGTLKVLQCGDPTGTGSGGPGYSFADETRADMTYPAGTVAMANAGANTNGSQFFLVYADSTLPPQYTVFGHITAGLDVLKAIAAAGVADGSDDGSPAKPVTITKVSVS